MELEEKRKCAAGSLVVPLNLYKNSRFCFFSSYITMTKADVITCYVLITDKSIIWVIELDVMLHVYVT